MRRTLRVFAVTIVVVVLAGVAGTWWWRARTGTPLSFNTATVTRGDVAATIGATGTIEPLEVVDVGAQVAGKALNLSVYYGNAIYCSASLTKQ